MVDENAASRAEPATGEVLSPAEMKRRAKADKQARRAAQKGDTVEHAGDSANAAQQSSPRSNTQPTSPATQSTAKSMKTQQSQAKKGPTAETKPMAIRRRASQTGPLPVSIKKKEKVVELFSHLYSHTRRRPQDPIPRDVHPMVVSVGLQMSDFTICGSSARCVAMLIAFKNAIQAYSTPVGTSLARHLTSHYLSPQIDFLKSCRPLSESMGNAIRFLKKRIVEIDPSIDDDTAKAAVCEDIDTFIRERIYVTGHAIAETASKQIKNGSVVLVYAKSALVEKTILHALNAGTQFRVMVVDSRPLFEGKSLARSLLRHGIQIDYLPLAGASHAVKDATIVLLGAHSMLSNGRLQSRVGTATVSMLAHKAGLPVIVCCESLKFSGKVALDSIVQNEVASPDEILTSESDNLQPLNLLYDVTPAEYIRMVICEYGSLPPSSIPVVHRLANEGI